MASPVHVGRALGSLRNSNFDTVSAIGEVIDNSIQANAKTIKLKIKKNVIRKNKIDLTEIAFADDGTGMTVDTLERCLQLGFSDRYNRRDGIGRFGVGMTLGAVTQCTRIEVYSKPRGGGWNFTYLDLSEIAEQEDPEIPPPRPAEVPREYAELVSDHGTLVIWKNWDREDAKIEEIDIWIGRTYRKFIGKQIVDDSNTVVPNPDQRHIFLDDGDGPREISPYDPLYVIQTKYNEETTQLESPIELEEDVHKFDAPTDNGHEPRKITIRTSIVPESWRPMSQYYGRSKENTARLIPWNEGISILRNNREVFYGHIPHYKVRDKTSTHYTGFIDLDRYWGCEISFDANLDYQFSIKNIKVGAKPVKELREKIEDVLNPTILTFRENIRATWKKNKDDARQINGDIESDDAEETIRTTTPTPPAESTDLDNIIKASGETRKENKEILMKKLENNPVAFLQNFNTDERGSFIDIISRGGRTLINMNMKHPFFRKYDSLIEKIKDGSEMSDKGNREKISDDINQNILLLLASFALGKKDIKPDEQHPAEDVLDKLIHLWTFYLDKNVRTTLEK